MTAAPGVESFLPQLVRGAAGARQEPGDVTIGVRAYIGAVHEHLHLLHREGGSGRAVNEAHSDLMDRLVRRLFDLAEAQYYRESSAAGGPLCIAAVGGYARREMSRHSDVDLLFLHHGEVDAYVAHFTEKVQLWLWDGGLKIGSATRNIEESLALASTDATVATAILDGRFLVGDPGLFHRFMARFRDVVLANPAAFIAEQIRLLRERHAKYGDSLYLLQPNLKEGAGALRDYHAANWAMRTAVPASRGLDDFLHQGLLTEGEMGEYRAALEFLWRVRNELHWMLGRPHDQMSFELQERIAERFGYAGGEGAELPVERFMGHYYRHARAIRNFSEIVIEQCHARVRPPQPPAATEEVEDGFRLAPDHLEIPHGAHLRERPVRLLTVFAVAQDCDVPLSRTAQRLVREHLDLIDGDFRSEPEATRTLLRILESERRVMRTLMQMNEVGVLGRLLPEWEHVVCRWQHVLYHTYTVDVHSIFLIEELRRLYRGKYEQQQPGLTEMVRSADRVVLFLGSLLHDIGKGRGGDHSNRGVPFARSCVERLGLSPERQERVIFLVRYHLIMSAISQRRDLSDPRLIVDFAKTMGDRENLRNLYLLTFADIRASSTSAWNEWKGSLLRELFERTSEFLETGGEDEAKAHELIESRVEIRQQGARSELLGLGVPEEEIQRFFDDMPRRYFVSHTPRQIARHAQVVLSFQEEQIVSTSFREMRGGFSEFLLCTRDVFGLYANVAGTLTARNINILGANVYSTRSGLALEVYRLSTPEGGPDQVQRTWERFGESLREVISAQVDVETLLRRYRPPVGRTPTPSRTPPSVSISNEESDFYTIVDVSANDRKGLLYDLTRTISRHDLEIYISKAATVLDQVTDAFYVKDRSRRKLTDAARLGALRQDLLDVVRAGEGGDGA